MLILSLLDISPEEGLLDIVIVLFLVFKGTSIFFSIEAASFYTPTDSISGFQFLHIFTSPCYLCGVFLVGGGGGEEFG